MNEDKKYEYILNMGKLMRYHDEPNKDIRDGSYKDIEVYNIDTGKWGIEEGLNMSWLYDAIRITKEKAEFFIANPDILRADKSEGGYPDPYDD